MSMSIDGSVHLVELGAPEVRVVGKTRGARRGKRYRDMMGQGLSIAIVDLVRKGLSEEFAPTSDSEELLRRNLHRSAVDRAAVAVSRRWGQKSRCPIGYDERDKAWLLAVH